MADKKIQTSKKEQGDGEPKRRRKEENHFTRNSIRAVVVLVVAVVSLLASVGLAGSVGEFLVRVYRLLFGTVYMLIPLSLLGLGIAFARFRTFSILPSQYLGMLLGLLGFFGFLHLFVPIEEATQITSAGVGGGYFGVVLGLTLRKAFGEIAAGVVLVGLTLVSLFLVFGSRVLVVKALLKVFPWMWRKAKAVPRPTWQGTESQEGGFTFPAQESGTKDGVFVRRDIESGEQGTLGAHPAFEWSGELTQDQLLPAVPRRRSYKKVDLPIDLLNGKSGKATAGDVEAIKDMIQKTFANFNIEVEMGEVSVGPTVTQYTLRPAEGVKLSQITALANDIALAIAAHPIRIEAPIPGKSLVGIEVPNQQIAVVPLKEVIVSEEFKRRKTNLTIALGKDVAGRPWVADLGVMPHILIAGATGSGKSVMINSLIVSLLYQNQPDDLKFILVDPKRVEMTPYNDIPHLLTPVITEVDKTINALKWVVVEMDNRFKSLAQAGKRNVESFNMGRIDKMPYIVVIIDELADLMSIAAGEVEAAIIRLAQMARAVGIHLVVATQRPSVDIITGLIKANILTRIAFAVASIVDSRTILDISGAEKLLGRGDMLYTSASLSKPKRLQGVFVSEEEVERVTGYLKESFGEPLYEEAVTEKIAKGFGAGFGEGHADDHLLPQARELVIQTRQASASFLQRRLSVGYSRAARLLDLLESEGVIGPTEGAKPRRVLVSRGDELGGEELLDDGSSQGEEAAEASGEDEVSERES